MQENKTKWIKTVKERWEELSIKKINSYLVNNSILVPKIDGNRDYESVKVWLETNTAEPQYTTAQVAEMFIKEQVKALSSAIQTELDNKANESHYDSMMSARSYAGYENPFQAEAQKLAVWASSCWVVAGQIEADVQSGNRDMPTIDEVLSELPIYE